MRLGRYDTPVPLRYPRRFHAYAAKQAGERVVVTVQRWIVRRDCSLEGEA